MSDTADTNGDAAALILTRLRHASCVGRVWWSLCCRMLSSSWFSEWIWQLKIIPRITADSSRMWTEDEVDQHLKHTCTRKRWRLNDKQPELSEILWISLELKSNTRKALYKNQCIYHLTPLLVQFKANDLSAGSWAASSSEIHRPPSSQLTRGGTCAFPVKRAK